MPNAADTVYALAKTPIRVFGHLANDALALARSTDGGTTFQAPRLMLPDPTTSIIHVPGGLVVAPNGDLLASFMASASPIRGRLYVAFLTAVDDRLQVMVVASSDTGRTWGSPVKVNDDVGTANHSTPQIAVNERGVVAVTWNDRRADPDDLCFRATVSASVDGGVKFLTSVPMDTASVCPLGKNSGHPLRLDGFTGRYVQGGETQGLAGLPGGKFLTVFVGGGRTMQLRSAMIEISVARPQR